MPDPIQDTIDKLTAAGATDEEITDIIREKFGKPGGPGSALDVANKTPLKEPTTYGGGLLKGFMSGAAEGASDFASGVGDIARGAYNTVRHPIETAEHIATNINKSVDPHRVEQMATEPRPSISRAIGQGVGTIGLAAAPQIAAKAPDAMVRTGGAVDRTAGAVGRSPAYQRLVGQPAILGSLYYGNYAPALGAAAPYALQGAGKALAGAGRMLGGGKPKFMEPPTYPVGTPDLGPPEPPWMKPPTYPPETPSAAPTSKAPSTFDDLLAAEMQAEMQKPVVEPTGTTPPEPTITSPGREGDFYSSGRPSVSRTFYQGEGEGVPPEPSPAGPPPPSAEPSVLEQQLRDSLAAETGVPDPNAIRTIRQLHGSKTAGQILDMPQGNVKAASGASTSAFPEVPRARIDTWLAEHPNASPAELKAYIHAKGSNALSKSYIKETLKRSGMPDEEIAALGLP